MKKRQIIKLAVIVAIFGAIVYFLMAGFYVGVYKVGPLPEKVPLGLDLTGGVYAVYQTDQGDFSDSEYNAKMETTVSVLRNRLDEKGYTEATIVQQGADRIRVEIPINQARTKRTTRAQLTEFLITTGELEFCDINGNTAITGDQVKQAMPVVMTNENGSQEYAVKLVFDSSKLRKSSPR